MTKKSLSAAKSRQLTKLLTISKTSNMNAVMHAYEVAKIAAVVFNDIGIAKDAAMKFPEIWGLIDAGDTDFYSLRDEFLVSSDCNIDPSALLDLIDFGERSNDDFSTYLACLLELHKRRRKFGLILQRQPMPTMVQVSPRALVEYGSDFPQEALASWLTWRKFFYDLDNRSAQETGYLFEPILAAAIGGEPKSARDKVVMRTADNSKGRQVDCWKVDSEGKPLAYEFKLRVTIAASGQGRFAEEVSFAEDCKNSNAIPVLVVLDPTENEKLTGLKDAYKQQGGHAYIGEEAWKHLEVVAGKTMASFIDKYVKKPVKEISSHETVSEIGVRSIQLLPFGATVGSDKLTLSFGQHIRVIHRSEDPALADDSEDEPSDLKPVA